MVMNGPGIDKSLVRRAFAKAAAGYDAVAGLQRDIGERLLERLDYIKLQPRRVLDLGCGTGVASGALLKRYAKAQVIALDFALPMLTLARRQGRWLRRPRCLCADAERLPLADQSLDLVFSNLALQWCPDLGQVFAETRRVLRPGGLFMFSTFGADSLKELRAAWSQVDGYSHVNSFLDLHQVGDLLLATPFQDPVVDLDRLQCQYGSVADLMGDLKQLGAHNVTQDRPRGLTGRRRLTAMLEAYGGMRVDEKYPVSYEIIYGLAWVPEHSSPPGTQAIPLDALRRSLPSHRL